MIAADSSSISAYFKGESGDDIQRLDSALVNGLLRLPPVVITELLSDPAPPAELGALLSQIAFLDVMAGYWERAGLIRRRLRVLGFKAKVADALIAQSCIDHEVALITRDEDFRHFQKHCGLKLA